MATYTTFYSNNPQWFSYGNGTADIQIYGCPSYMAKSNKKPIDLTPIYEVGQTLLYVGYMLRFKKVATHKISAINEKGYVIKSKYPDNDDYVLDFEKTHDKEEWMELREGAEKYPDIYLNSPHNGPEMYQK